MISGEFLAKLKDPRLQTVGLFLSVLLQRVKKEARDRIAKSAGLDYFHSRHSATPPRSPASFETISIFLPGLKSIFLVLPPPR